MLKNDIKTPKFVENFQFLILNYTRRIIWSQMLSFGAKIIYISRTRNTIHKRIQYGKQVRRYTDRKEPPGRVRG